MNYSVSLKVWNTFGIEAYARELVVLDAAEGLFSMPKPDLILGGGSNMLFTKDVDGLVLVNKLRGIEIVGEEEQYTWIRVAGGEVWHDVVRWAVSLNLGGIENLSLIPGTVGAAPIQNIGAYGVELKDTFEELTAWSFDSRVFQRFSQADCQFGYRDSIFKHPPYKGNYLITSVTLRLAKHPTVNTSYGDIAARLAASGVLQPTIQDVSEAVIAIRQAKLPNPQVLGNAGSFFKNPEVSLETYTQLQTQYPQMPRYHTPHGVKIPAAWLIEQCGWKGKRIGNTGTHTQQALVLVNYGGATGTEIWEHALRIQADVQHRFGIYLTPEVNVYA
jgi:UDP-N-acetylmuramate dehydrogenase